MADQGLWFKLWCASLDDPDLDNLPLEDFGRWCKLGAFIKRQGVAGSVALKPPCLTLCALFHVTDFDALMAVFHRLPHVTVRRGESPVSSETIASVTFDNWARYQGDYSTHRVRRSRAMKRIRGEETKEENKKREEVPPKSPGELLTQSGSNGDQLEALRSLLPRTLKAVKPEDKLWAKLRTGGPEKKTT